MNKKIVTASKEESKFVVDKIIAFNRDKIQPINDPPLKLNYVIKDKGRIIAGINTVIYWTNMQIDVLYVNEEYREKKLGSKLLSKVENEAREKGVFLCYLATFDFQAKNFYIKNGYEIFGTLNDCLKGHQHYYLKKKL